MRFSLVKFSNTKYISKYVRLGVISNACLNLNSKSKSKFNQHISNDKYKSLYNSENESFKNENESLKNEYILLKFRDYEEIVNKNYNMI